MWGLIDQLVSWVVAADARDDYEHRLTDLVTGEVDRQLRERSDVLDAMKMQMAKVLREFEDLTWTAQTKRSWTKAVAKASRDFAPTPTTVAIHPVTTTGNVINPPSPASPVSRLPKCVRECESDSVCRMLRLDGRIWRLTNALSPYSLIHTCAAPDSALPCDVAVGRSTRFRAACRTHRRATTHAAPTGNSSLVRVCVRPGPVSFVRPKGGIC